MKQFSLAILFFVSILMSVPSTETAAQTYCFGTVVGLSGRYDPSTGAGFLAIRAGPTSQATQVGELFNGDVIKIVRQNGKWLLIINADDDSGWVYRRYVSHRCGF